MKKKVIVILIIFSLIFISIFTLKKEEEKEINNKNISVILETEEGNIESNTFPNKNEYEYLNTKCKNTNNNINATFNENTWKLNLNVEEERVDGKFNCTVHFKENTPPNPPELNGDMVPVYYDEAGGVWRKADETNASTEHKWYDYSNKMWANSVSYDHTKILDLSGKNNDASPSGAEYTNEGMYFDGVDDHVDAGYANYDFNNQLTVIARFKTEEYSSTGGVIVDNYGHEGGVATGFEFFVGATGRVVLQFFNKVDGTNERVNVTSEIIELNTWYTAVGTYDGQTMKIYLNGELVNEKALTPDEMNGINSSQNIWLGANPYDGGMHLYNGTVSDVILINDVLTEEEIQENYSAEVTHYENDNTLFSYDLQGYEGKNDGEVVPMEAISTMQVWIPRYKYKVWNYNLDGTKTSEEQEIEIKFESGTNTTGEIKCTDNIQGEGGDGTSEVCTLNNEECSDALCNGAYYTHPAFTFGSVDLTGFWVGKFEVSGETNFPKVLPNVTSEFNPRLSIVSNGIMNMSNNNGYGFNTNVDTHMIKNSEWGAVAYLSHSKYGTCIDGICKEIGRNNNSNHITGCGSEPRSNESTVCNEYNSILGKSASTTGNIYGVYDMSGGKAEFVMGNIVGPDGVTMMSGRTSTSNSGYSGLVYDNGAYSNYAGAYSYPEEKYYDKYSFASNIDISLGKLGDSTKETYLGERSWYNGNYGFVNAVYPWFGRGGSASNTNSGIFFFTNSTGHSTVSVSSHLIIVP